MSIQHPSNRSAATGLRARARRISTAALALAALAFAAAPDSAMAQQRRSAPGQFDFYVLSLSWSPTYCADSAERGRHGGPQCAGRPYSFVVHGLWPQYERGFPSDCKVPAPRLPRAIVNRMLDLMPAPRLVFHEWDKHGTCSGLQPEAYFDLVRRARAAVNIPAVYTAPLRPLQVSPAAVEAAFIQANPGLSPRAIAVTCGGTRLSEVRICMSKDLRFRDCNEIDRRACRRDRLNMPPVRGG